MTRGKPELFLLPASKSIAYVRLGSIAILALAFLSVLWPSPYSFRPAGLKFFAPLGLYPPFPNRPINFACRYAGFFFAQTIGKIGGVCSLWVSAPTTMACPGPSPPAREISPREIGLGSRQPGDSCSHMLGALPPCGHPVFFCPLP